MAKWTESAKTEWKAYSQRLRNQLNGTEADAAEVEEDLKRHVDEEIHAQGLTVIDAEQLRSILTRLGELEVPEESGEDLKTTVRRASKESNKTEPKSNLRFGVLVLTSVLWPLIALIIEVYTRFCTAVIFDPIPTVWHGLILFGIPVGNLLALSRLKSDDSVQPHWMSFFVAFNLGVSLIYTLLFIPVLPIGFIFVIWFGFGLLPLTPWQLVFRDLSFGQNVVSALRLLS